MPHHNYNGKEEQYLWNHFHKFFFLDISRESWLQPQIITLKTMLPKSLNGRDLGGHLIGSNVCRGSELSGTDLPLFLINTSGLSQPPNEKPRKMSVQSAMQLSDKRHYVCLYWCPVPRFSALASVFSVVDQTTYSIGQFGELDTLRNVPTVLSYDICTIRQAMWVNIAR